MTVIDTAQIDRVQTASSVEAAIAALGHLEASLRQGGFPEGAPAYQRMAEVLVAQRFHYEAAFEQDWDEDDALSDRFSELGNVARRVFALLDPYAGAMRRLAAMAPEPLSEQAVEAVMGQLERRGRRGATASVLARSTRLPGDVVARALAAMVADGRVAVRRAGEVETFRCATPPGKRVP